MKLYHGDCLEIMKTLDPESVDMVITDPPYFLPNIQFRPAMRQQTRTWEGNFALAQHMFATYIDAVLRLAKPDFELYVFGDDLMTAVIYPVLYSRFYNTKTLVWDKGRIGLGGKWRRQYENIIYAYRGDVKEGASGRSDILKFTSPRDKDHPYQKPVDLLCYLLTASKPGVLLDPFMGSGATMRAAKSCGWEGIGIEIEEKYYQAAENKINQIEGEKS